MSIGRRIFNCLELGTHHPEGRREGGTCRGKAPPRRRENNPTECPFSGCFYGFPPLTGAARASVENRCYVIIIQSLNHGRESRFLHSGSTSPTAGCQTTTTAAAAVGEGREKRCACRPSGIGRERQLNEGCERRGNRASAGCYL